MDERNFTDELRDALLRDADLDLEPYEPGHELSGAAFMLIVAGLGVVVALLMLGYCVGRWVR